MSVKEIEVAIQELTPKERAELIAMLVEQHNDEWDEEIADDLKAGRLENWIAEARSEYVAGLVKPL